MHKTIERQLTRLKGRYTDPSELLEEFISVVDASYSSFEKEQRLKDRAIHLMAAELEEVHRKHHEKNKAYNDAILDSIVDGVIIVSMDGIILNLNRTASGIIGDSPENMQKRALTDILDGYHHFGDFLSDHLGYEAGRQTVQILNRNFEKTPCSVSISHFDKFDEPIYILLLRDISEQQKADARIIALNEELRAHVHQLEVSNKDLESFSSSISHDLRTPLAFVTNFIKALEEMNADRFDEKSKRLTGMISKYLERMDHLIEDILMFSRSGQKEPDKSNVDIKNLVSKILVEQSAQQTQHRVHVHELLPAYCDGSLIYQVLSNLISNALKYSAKVEKPVIEIGSKQILNEILYFVADNGAGFDEDKSDQIFEPFQRLHSDAEFKGTGIGLSIARRIVAKHGGRIWANGKKDSGATFFFTLPVPRENLDEESLGALRVER